MLGKVKSRHLGLALTPYHTTLSFNDHLRKKGPYKKIVGKEESIANQARDCQYLTQGHLPISCPNEDRNIIF